MKKARNTKPYGQDRAARLLRAAYRLYGGATVTSSWLRQQFPITRATAKRDLATLARVLPVKCEQKGPGGRRVLTTTIRRISALGE